MEIGGRDSWVMYGPAFFRREWSEYFLPVLEAYYSIPGTEQFHWENVYMDLANGTAQKRLLESGFSELNGLPVKQFADSIPNIKTIPTMRPWSWYRGSFRFPNPKFKIYSA